MTYTYSFEKLEVWQLSRELVKEAYRITNLFPKEEHNGLKKLIRHSAISVSSNLAEGSTLKTQKEQANYTQTSYLSLMDLLNQLILAEDLNFIDQEWLGAIRPKIEMLSNKLNSLYKSQIK